MKRWLLIPGLLVCGALVAGAQPPAPAQRVYTEAQAKRGQVFYQDFCEACHGPALAGDTAAPLVGPKFEELWIGKSYRDLFEKIRVTMPPDAPGTITVRRSRRSLPTSCRSIEFRPGRPNCRRTSRSSGRSRLHPRNRSVLAPQGGVRQAGRFNCQDTPLWNMRNGRAVVISARRRSGRPPDPSRFPRHAPRRPRREHRRSFRRPGRSGTRPRG